MCIQFIFAVAEIEAHTTAVLQAHISLFGMHMHQNEPKEKEKLKKIILVTLKLYTIYMQTLTYVNTIKKIC